MKTDIIVNMIRTFKKTALKMVSAVTLCAFVFNCVVGNVLSSRAFAVTVSDANIGNMLSGSTATAGQSMSGFDVEGFTLPKRLGNITDRFEGDQGKTIIHIQDAHCNYYAQRKISEILEFLRKEYGTTTVNLEGGAGKYDLSLFSGIKDAEIRKTVTDAFVKEGYVSGGEAFAINNYPRVRLWGAETAGLYLKNLSVYRGSIDDRKKAGVYIGYLEDILKGLKAHIYSKELLDLDGAYAAYRSGKMEFRDYVIYLRRKAGEMSVPMGDLVELDKLSKSMSLERDIDFNKANDERDNLIEKLRIMLSRTEFEKLAVKTIELKRDIITSDDFYSYLFSRARFSNLDMKDFPELKKYIRYLNLYHSSDRLSAIDEMSELRDRIAGSMAENDKQKKLYTLSGNLSVLKDLFGFSLTRKTYEYYIKNRSVFDVSNYAAFIRENGSGRGISDKKMREIYALDRLREKVVKFYEYGFERDTAFVKNIRFPETGSRNSVIVLITGGFHTGNLCRLLREHNISYVSIIPVFKNPDGYKCPYFDILAGKKVGLQERLYPIIAARRLIAVPTMFSAAVAEAWGKADIDSLKAEARIRELAEENKWTIKNITSEGVHYADKDGKAGLLSIMELVKETVPAVSEKPSGETKKEKENTIPLKDVMRDYNVFVVHGFSMDYTPANNSLFRTGTTWQQKANALLAIKPVISASTISIGDSLRNMWSPLGFILKGGIVEAASTRDIGSKAKSVNVRINRQDNEIDINSQVEDAVNLRQENAYNELSVKNPDVAGFYISLDGDVGYINAIFRMADADYDVFKKFIDKIRSYGLPIYILNNGKVYKFEGLPEISEGIIEKIRKNYDPFCAISLEDYMRVNIANYIFSEIRKCIREDNMVSKKDILNSDANFDSELLKEKIKKIERLDTTPYKLTNMDLFKDFHRGMRQWMQYMYGVSGAGESKRGDEAVIPEGAEILATIPDARINYDFYNASVPIYYRYHGSVYSLYEEPIKLWGRNIFGRLEKRAGILEKSNLQDIALYLNDEDTYKKKKMSFDLQKIEKYIKKYQIMGSTMGIMGTERRSIIRNNLMEIKDINKLEGLKKDTEGALNAISGLDKKYLNGNRINMFLLEKAFRLYGFAKTAEILGDKEKQEELESKAAEIIPKELFMKVYDKWLDRTGNFRKDISAIDLIKRETEVGEEVLSELSWAAPDVSINCYNVEESLSDINKLVLERIEEIEREAEQKEKEAKQSAEDRAKQTEAVNVTAEDMLKKGFDLYASGEVIVPGVIKSIMYRFSEKEIIDVGSIVFVDTDEISPRGYKNLKRSGGIVIIGENKECEEFVRTFNIPALKISSEDKINEFVSGIPEYSIYREPVTLFIKGKDALILSSKGNSPDTEERKTLIEKIAEKGIVFNENIPTPPGELERLLNLLEVLPKEHLEGLERIESTGDSSLKGFVSDRKYINLRTLETDFFLHENLHRILMNLSLFDEIPVKSKMFYISYPWRINVIFLKALQILGFRFDIIVQISPLSIVKFFDKLFLKIFPGLQLDFLSGYSYLSMSKEESAAELYKIYVNYGDAFRRLASGNKEMAKKYEYFKNKVFNGIEYTRNRNGRIVRLSEFKKAEKFPEKFKALASRNGIEDINKMLPAEASIKVRPVEGNAETEDLIGKLFTDQVVHNDATLACDISVKKQGKKLLFAGKNGETLYDKNGREVKEVNFVDREVDKSRLGFGDISTDGLSGPDKDIAEKILDTFKDKKIYMLEGNDHGIRGAPDNAGNIYLTEDLIEHPVALFHETGESFKTQIENKTGINAHTFLRGCGEDARALLEVTNNPSVLENADTLINYLKKKLPRGRANQDEFALIRYNAGLGARGTAMIYGLQDKLFGEEENEHLPVTGLTGAMEFEEYKCSKTVETFFGNKAKAINDLIDKKKGTISHDYKLSYVRGMTNIIQNGGMIPKDTFEGWKILLGLGEYAGKGFIDDFNYLVERDVILLHRLLTENVPLKDKRFDIYRDEFNEIGLNATGRKGIEQLKNSKEVQDIIEEIINTKGDILGNIGFAEKLYDKPILKTLVAARLGFNSSEWGHGARFYPGLDDTWDFLDFISEHNLKSMGNKPLDDSLQGVEKDYSARRAGKADFTIDARMAYRKFYLIITRALGYLETAYAPGEDIDGVTKSISEDVEGAIAEKREKIDRLETVKGKSTQKNMNGLKKQITLLYRFRNRVDNAANMKELFQVFVDNMDIITGENSLKAQMIFLSLVFAGYDFLMNGPPNKFGISKENGIALTLENDVTREFIDRLFKLQNRIKEVLVKMGFFKSGKDKKLVMFFRRIFKTMVFKDAEDRISEKEKRIPMKAFIVKNDLGELTGDFCASCINQVENVMGYPGLVGAVIFSMEEDGVRNLAGSFLIIERKIKGQKVWMLRGINPTYEYLLDKRYSAVDFFTASIDFAMKLAGKYNRAHTRAERVDALALPAKRRGGVLTNFYHIEEALEYTGLNSDRAELDPLEGGNSKELNGEKYAVKDVYVIKLGPRIGPTVLEKEPSPPPEKTPVEKRSEAINRAISALQDKGGIVKAVIGQASSIEHEAIIESTVREVNRKFAAGGFGVVEVSSTNRENDKRQIVTFKIYTDSPDAQERTRDSYEKAMERADRMIKETGGQIVLFVPQMDKGPRLMANALDEYKNRTDVTILPDAYSDNDPEENRFIDINVRAVLARLIVNAKECFKGADKSKWNTEGGELALKTLNNLLKEVTPGWDENKEKLIERFVKGELDLAKELNGLLLRIKAIDYQDIVRWAEFQKAVDTSL